MTTVSPSGQPFQQTGTGTLRLASSSKRHANDPLIPFNNVLGYSGSEQVVDNQHRSQGSSSIAAVTSTVTPFSSQDNKPIDKNAWVRDLASYYDYCLVFPSAAYSNGQFTVIGTSYIHTLRKLGFELFIYKNLKPTSEIYVLIRSQVDKLRAYADNCDYRMLLDPVQIEECLLHGNMEEHIQPVEIAHMPEITKLRPFEKIYGRYSRNIPESLYYHEEGEDDPFRELIKLKLTSMIMNSRPADGSKPLKIRRFILNGTLLGYFPLHNRYKTKTIEKKWEHYPFKRLPLTEFKEYFGEKLGLYFGFMEHYCTFLWIPAVVGIPFQVAVFKLDNYSAPFIPVYSFLVSLWSVFMLEFWKRKEKSLALDWGTINFENTEIDRPDFRGEKIPSYIDGSTIKYFSTKKRNAYIRQSFLVVSTLMLLVIGIVVGIYILRYAIVHYVGDSAAQSIASGLNSILIQVMNMIYSVVAHRLSERENHRTDTHFEDTFVAKNIDNGCPDGDCMKVLAYNLGIIFGTRLVIGNFTELFVPYLSFRWKYHYQVVVHGKKISRPEKEFLLQPYDLMSSSLADYAEVAILYGYTAMFITALPVASFFALISTMVEIRGDGWKLFNIHQRPIPKTAEDIGSWQLIFQIITVVSVIINAGLVVFTMDTLEFLSDSLRFWIFILFQWVCFALQALIMTAVPDIPEEIDIQLARTDFIVSKIINKVGDDNTSDITGIDGPIEFQTYPLDEGGHYAYNSHLLTRDMK